MNEAGVAPPGVMPIQQPITQLLRNVNQKRGSWVHVCSTALSRIFAWAPLKFKPLSIEEIDRAIRVLPARDSGLVLNTLSDLLRLDPSIDVRERAPNGVQGDLSIRGATFGQNFIPFLKGRGMPKAPRAFEWCAGAGFVGFSAMANGLCETLALADISEEAIKACRHTIAKNRLGSRAIAYVSDNLRDIPRSEKWDLVLGNPPHHADEYFGDRRGFDENA